MIDLLLSNWAAYLAKVSRPISTIGASTPNLETTWWGETIDGLTHLLLPTIALTLISIASYTRYTRASMLEVLNQDYIRTARSKGVSERKVITRHALRNALIPLATIVAFDFANLIKIYPSMEFIFFKRIAFKDNFFTIELDTEVPGNYTAEKYITFKYSKNKIVLHRFRHITYWWDERKPSLRDRKSVV